MYGSPQRRLDPFRVRWGLGKGSTGRILRASASLLGRSRGGPPLLMLTLWVAPAVLLLVLHMAQLQPGLEAGMLQGLTVAGQASWGAMGAGLLDILRSLLFTPLLLYALARVFLGELSLRRPTPVQAVRACIDDWRRALWLAVLCMIGLRLLNYLPTLVFYLLGMLIAFLTAFFSWVPGLVAALEAGAAVLLALLRSLVSFLGLGAAYGIWMVAATRELRGMSAVGEGIHLLRERAGLLGRLTLACWPVFLLGGEGIWLLYGWLGGAVHWLALLSPLLSGLALLALCAGSTQVCYGDGGEGGDSLREHIAPRDLSKMKSANIKDE